MAFSKVIVLPKGYQRLKRCVFALIDLSHTEVVVATTCSINLNFAKAPPYSTDLDLMATVAKHQASKCPSVMSQMLCQYISGVNSGSRAVDKD